MAGAPGRSGGAREGAGRKTTREKHATAVNRAEKRIADRLPEIIDWLFELAEGVTVQERDATGRERVYTRPPCFKSASYLVDRILGRPVQATEQELSGPHKGPLTVATLEGALTRAYGDDESGEPD